MRDSKAELFNVVRGEIIKSFKKQDRRHRIKVVYKGHR